MTLKGVLDRKLFMLVGSLVLKRLGTVFATYLVATGIPADSAGQLLSAIAALLALVSDIAFDLIEKRRVADKATRQLLDAQGKSVNLDEEWHKDLGDPLQKDLENPLSVLRKPLPLKVDWQDVYEKIGH